MSIRRERAACGRIGAPWWCGWRARAPNRNRQNAAMTGPLSNLKVVELGTLIAGPYCARLLGEFGAEVIKVEAPGAGDPLRKWRKLHEGNSLWWYAQARNKKSVAIDLRRAEGQEVLRRLAQG